MEIKKICETCGDMSDDKTILPLDIDEDYTSRPSLKGNFNKYFGERTKMMHQCFNCSSIFVCREIDNCDCSRFDGDKFICFCCEEDKRESQFKIA